MKRAIWILTIAAAVNYAVLIWFGVGAIGWTKTLDFYVTGYSYEQAIALVSRWDFETALYMATTVRKLDTSFPVLMGLALAGWIWLGAQERGRYWRLLAVIPLGYAGVDLYENSLIAQVLTGMMPTPELVSQASMMTLTKWVLFGLSLVALFFTTSDEEG